MWAQRMTFLTPAEVGELLKVSPKTVSRWALEDPTMPATRIGRVVRFESQALDRWLRAHGRRRPGADAAQVAVITGEGS